MEIEYLKRFIAVGEYLNFRKAANSLFISQPTLSHSITALENEIDAGLLIRNTKNVELTPEGRQFLSDAKEIINLYDKALNNIAKKNSKDENILKIGYCGPAISNLLTPAIKEFRRLHSDCEVHVIRLRSTEIKSAFEEDRVQIASIYEEYLPELYGMESEITAPEDFKVLVNKQSELSARQSISLKDLVDQPLIICERDSAPLYYDRIMSIFSSEGYIPRISQKVYQISDIYKLVDMNFGVAVMSVSDTNFYKLYENIRFLDISGASQISHNRVLTWKKNPSPPVREFRRLMHADIPKD